MRRAIEYQQKPTEVNGMGNSKGIICSRPFTGKVEAWPEGNKLENGSIYLKCGDSSRTQLPNKTVDLVITDPPFFDNVHYSELADFFYAWQKLIPKGFIQSQLTTRNIAEVQDCDPLNFSSKLKSVFLECNRILKDDGLLLFTYHHSKKT